MIERVTPAIEALCGPPRGASEYPRDRVPLQWAGRQNNLGRVLGERESTTGRLEAITA